VGSYRHLSDEAIGRKSVRWLFNTYELVQRRCHNEAISRISEMEWAVMRALHRFLAKKGAKLPGLPAYEEVAAEAGRACQKEPERPAWMLRYEEVNQDRMTRRSGNEESNGKDALGIDG